MILFWILSSIPGAGILGPSFLIQAWSSNEDKWGLYYPFTGTHRESHSHLPPGVSPGNPETGA